MSGVKGLVVRLKTSSIRKWAGTDDPIYIGVVGKGGGREFPLDVEGRKAAFLKDRQDDRYLGAGRRDHRMIWLQTRFARYSSGVIL